LSQEEDEQLRAIEQSPHMNKKVRLRSQMIRLSNQRWEMSRIAGYVGCHVRTVGAALNAWVSRKFEGLADRPQKGNRRKLHAEALQFMRDKLAEDRCWNARQLTEAIALEFGIQVDEESVRRNLRQLGYAWKRDRYVVAGQPDPQLLRQAEAALDTLKRGRSKVGSF
jgi:transposase